MAKYENELVLIELEKRYFILLNREDVKEEEKEDVFVFVFLVYRSLGARCT